VLRPWNAAALPEFMAGAVQDGERSVPMSCADGKAAGQQPSSVAGVRGRGVRKPSSVTEAQGGEEPKAKVRPNVEVNRRAEGTSEL